MKRSRGPKVAGPTASDEGTSEVWESRMGIVKTFIVFAAVVTSLRVGKPVCTVKGPILSICLGPYLWRSLIGST